MTISEIQSDGNLYTNCYSLVLEAIVIVAGSRMKFKRCPSDIRSYESKKGTSKIIFD